MGSYKVIGGDQKEYGPANEREVLDWIADGRLSGQSLAQREGDSNWEALSGFPEFSEALQAQAARFLAQTSAEGNWAGAAGGGISIGRCLSSAGQLVGENFGLLAGSCALVWLLGMVSQFLPLVGGFLYLMLEGVLYGGLCLIFLRRIRGQPAAIGDVFTGFGPLFTQLALAGAVTAMLSFVGVLLCVLPWVYLTVAWVFAVPLVADKGLSFWNAMELSRTQVTRVWFQAFLLMVAAFLPVIVMYIYAQVKIFSVAYPGFQALMSQGNPDTQQWLEFFTTVARTSMPLVMLNKVVLLFNLPFATGALMYAYEQLFRGRNPSAD
jgi:hypothetical protein